MTTQKRSLLFIANFNTEEVVFYVVQKKKVNLYNLFFVGIYNILTYRIYIIFQLPLIFAKSGPDD